MARSLIDRRATHEVARALRESRVVMVNGPRQAGKTTLVLDLLSSVTSVGTFLTFDDHNVLEAFREDPRTLLGGARPVVIDEFQLGGDRLLREVKLAVDRDPTPGQFLLTGSTRFLTVSNLSESLAGRVQIVDLWPLSQGEIDELGSGSDIFLERFLATGNIDPKGALPDRRGYFERVCRGGYPAVVGADPDIRRRFLRDYVRTVTQRDVPEIKDLQHISELPRLLKVLAATTAQEARDVKLAESTGLNRTSLVRNYLPTLESVYLTTQLPAWSRNTVARVARRPKRYIVDSGLASFLLGADASALSAPGSRAAGPLLETFVVGELIRQASRSEDRGIGLYHYRSHGGAEVDVVGESFDGRVVALEVKASASIGRGDFSSLARLRDQIDGLAGQTFGAGAVLYTGTDVLPFGDRLQALPVASLWLPTS